MGCDIHAFVEVKKRGKWNEIQELDIDRDYGLFAILAGVRNETEHGDGFKPISCPRGLPIDVSSSVRDSSDITGCDGHSHSWLTVKEIEEFNWEQTTKIGGLVDAHGFKEWQENGFPTGYSQGVGGTNTKIVSNKEMEKSLKDGSNGFYFYTVVKWEILYREPAKWFLNETIPILRKMGKPENVRIVFWFDN